MYELKNKYYHHTPYFIIIIFLEFIAMFFLAVFLSFNVPFIEIPYIGQWCESVLNQIQYTNLTIKVTINFIFNVFMYWGALILPLTLCTDFFFKHLIGYELSLRTSIKITGKKVHRFFLKYVSLFTLTILIAVLCKPLYEKSLRLMDSNISTLFLLIFPVAYIFGCYGISRILKDEVFSKILKKGKSNQLHQS